jgi:hypothetical protein
MKKLLLILVAVSVLLVGCSGQVQDIDYTDEQGGQVNVDFDTSNADMDSWCAEGAEWTGSYVASQGVGQDLNAEWTIDGIVEEGEFAGFCHVIYTLETDEGVMEMEYYFNEDETEAYVEMQGPDGSTFSQKITQ